MERWLGGVGVGVALEGKEGEQRQEDKREETMLGNYNRALSTERSFDSCPNFLTFHRPKSIL